MTESAEPTGAPPRSPFTRQLNVSLMVVQVISALIVVYGVVFVAVSGGEDGPQYEPLQVAFVFLLLPGSVVFFTARSARRRLAAQVVSARLWSILAGLFAIFAGLPLVQTVFGVVSIAAGLFTLTAGLLLKKDRLT